MIKQLIRRFGDLLRLKHEGISAEAHLGDQVQVGYGCLLGKVKIHGPVSIGRGTMINGPTQIKASPGATCEIGAFCSIAANVTIRTGNHPINTPSSFSVGRGPYRDVFSKDATSGSITIGNDVWIGAMCVILPSITIGNGAIVGAGAIVTHDVPAYSIVVGNPASLMRMRFPQHVIETLITLEWWNWSIERLKTNSHFFRTDISQLSEAELKNLVASLKA